MQSATLRGEQITSEIIKQMESYHTAGIILGLIVANFIAPLGGLMLVVINIVVLILSAAMKPRSHKTYGIVTIVLAVIGNLLLLIPGIMALRYKKEIHAEKADYCSYTNICKKCGHANRWDSSYCINCGSYLRENI